MSNAVARSLVVAGLLAGTGMAEDASSLRVMTFNIRNSTSQDGVNHWDLRRELCASRVTAADPDLVGMQEVREDQRAYLAAVLAGHTVLGGGRDDGKAKGEYCSIFVRTSRFILADSGTFWLSQTPDAPGRGWDAAFPRIATWARLRDRLNGDRELVWINTHLDNAGQTARVESARLIRGFLASRARGAAHLVTGDFNVEPGSAPYEALVGPGDDGVALVDTFRATHPGLPTAGNATFHAYQPDRIGTHIDWVLAGPGLAPLQTEIDRYSEAPRFPSDHYPVVANLRWR